MEFFFTLIFFILIYFNFYLFYLFIFYFILFFFFSTFYFKEYICDDPNLFVQQLTSNLNQYFGFYAIEAKHASDLHG
jgi:hypothetical protein